MPISKTIVINCAGMGKRLGLNTNKSLIDINGKPLIIRQLECLDKFDDIRIVVGYQAEELINVVCAYRKDIVFVFNHEYKTTRTAQSFSLGKKYARDMVISLDGDILFRPEDFEKFACGDEEIIGVCKPYTKEPVYVETDILDGQEYATGFSRKSGKYEWTGLLKIYSDKLNTGIDHVYKLITPNLPLKVTSMNLKEIDNKDEYEAALKWYKNNYK